MNLQDEVLNRRKCRANILGVLVAVDDAGAAVAIAGTEWGPRGDLVVRLADGSSYPADRLWLRSPWPWRCCRPARRNEWNPPVRRDRRRTGVRSQTPSATELASMFAADIGITLGSDIELSPTPLAVEPILVRVSDVDPPPTPEPAP